MSGLRHGRFEGATTAPQVSGPDMRTGSVLTADVHERQGNTTIHGNKGLYERVSIVFYYRERKTMRERHRRTERAKHAPRKQPAERPDYRQRSTGGGFDQFHRFHGRRRQRHISQRKST